MSQARNLTTLALLLSGAVPCALLADGYFLSDDFVQLANFAIWEAQGSLAAGVAGRFAASIDGVNGFWRPLTYATYALSYLAGEADPRGWLAVNLALHLANAILVGALVERLAAAPGARTRTAALFAGTVFFATASGWEAALWISSRYDALATFFTLLAGWWFAGGRPRLALVAALLALMSKEAGAIALVLVGALAIARDLEGASVGAGDRIRRLGAQLWPFVLLGLAYAGLRIALFGNATHAYVGVPIDLLSASHWAGLARTGIEWARAAFPGAPGLRPLAAVATLALLVMGLVMARRSRAATLGQLAMLACLAATVALLLTQVPGFDPSGIGGRLFYLPGALLASSLGLALAVTLEPVPGHAPAGRYAAAALAATLVALHLHWTGRATREYHAIHGEMRAVATGIAQVASSRHVPPALLLLPDALGRAPFGRNAQAGLMLPPVQREALTRHVLVQLDTEIPEIPAKVARGLFDWLSRHSLVELPPGNAPLPGARDVEPSAVFCWSPAERRFTRMALAPGDRSSLARRIEDAYGRSRCRREN